MDTSTHFVMGVGLFGLAHIDPVVLSHPETATAVMAGTIIGSQLPDTDSVYRLKGPSAYIRNHRGWTHSLPMMVIWPVLLTTLLTIFFPISKQWHVFFWSFIAVFIHIFIDLFNAYGTQALRPFSKKWISWNILNIFDPFIFGIHIIAFLLWWRTTASPSTIFTWLYILLITYIIWRTIEYHRILQWTNKQLSTTNRLTITPTIRWNVWNVIIELEDEIQIGEIRKKHLLWTGYLSTEALTHPAVKKSKKAEAVDAFLSFTSYGYPQIFERPHGYEVRWLDVRYHYKKHFSFVSVALLDHDYNIQYSFVGFMGEKLLEKRVNNLLGLTDTKKEG